MAILNITPDSFSDGGDYFGIDLAKKKFSNFLDNGVRIIDVGAQSTAPQSRIIEFLEEKNRFESILFPVVSQLRHKISNDLIISIDTYRYETFKFVSTYLKQFIKEKNIWWNDVSGVIDQDLQLFANENIESKYIFSLTNILHRELTSDHLSFIDFDLNSLNRFVDNSKKKISIIKKLLGKRFIVDPAFGFSKSLEQNHELMKSFVEFIENFDEDLHWLIGVSRKSFLRRPPLLFEFEQELEQQSREFLQSHFVYQLETHKKNRLFTYRSHEFNSIREGMRAALCFPL